MTAPLMIGILGAARISDLSIIEPAHQLGHRLVAVAARNRHRAELYAAENDIERVHDSYGDVINDPEVEVVYNSLLNSLHAPGSRDTTAADAVENMMLIDECYHASGFEPCQAITIERR